MNNKRAPASLAAFITATLTGNLAFAEEHAAEALKHANDAATSIGDSRMIRQHASEALKHIEAAKEANAHRPEVIEHLEKGEAELRDAVEHASHYNANTASDTASDAKAHLESAHSAAGAPETSKQ